MNNESFVRSVVKTSFPIVLLCAGVAGAFISCTKSPIGPLVPFPDNPLEKAYYLKSGDLLEQFFAEWTAAIPPTNESELENLSDTLRAIHAIFKIFYSPFDLSKVGGSEWGSGFYHGSRYVVVQTSMLFRADSVADIDTVKEFFPAVSFSEAGVVYLTDEYRDCLTDFLQADSTWEGRQKRMEFLNLKTKVVPGHWFGWHLVTHPEVFFIQFYENLTRARLYFRVIYQGGEAEFHREDNGWTMTGSRLIWIE